MVQGSRAQDLFKKAKTLVNSGDISGAIAAYHKILCLYPANKLAKREINKLSSTHVFTQIN